MIIVKESTPHEPCNRQYWDFACDECRQIIGVNIDQGVVAWPAIERKVEKDGTRLQSAAAVTHTVHFRCMEDFQAKHEGEWHYIWLEAALDERRMRMERVAQAEYEMEAIVRPDARGRKGAATIKAIPRRQAEPVEE